MTSSDVLDKKEYVTSSRQEVLDGPTFLSPSSLQNNIYQSREFRRSMVRNQGKYIKANYTENRNPRNILQRGDWYEIQGNYKRAVDFYLEALNSDPESKVIYKKIIDTYTKHHQFDRAEEYFKILLSKTDRYQIFKDYIVFKTTALKGDFSNIGSVLELIDTALEREPEDIDILALKGFLIMNSRTDLSEAKNIFEKVLKINKEYIHAVNNLGVCYLREKSYDKACHYLQNALEVDPYNYPFSYQNLANTYLEQNKIKEALNVLDSAVTKNVAIDNNYTHLYAWLLLEDLQLRKARILYEKLIRNEPKNNLLYNNLGVCYLREGESSINMADSYFRKAAAIFSDEIKKGVIKDIRSLNAFYNIGRIAVTRHDLSTVKEMSRVILELDPGNAYGFYFEANYWNQNEDYDGAISFYEKALSITKEVPEIYPEYSFVLTSIKRNHKKTIEILNEAIDLGYKSNFVINNLAVAYIKLGDLKKASELLEKSNNPEFIPFFATKGLLEIRKGNLEKGKKYYEDAIDLFKGVNKKLASQILFYETSLYWFNKKQKGKALENLNEAKAYGKTYMETDIKELEDKIGS
ncbi:MAG: tetratricopeptide repeat protein [Candidatus Pacebacteria bacterium]|nr:tetratricopeptide repeat protein [Candidatus Paceibacterota bacterium]